MGFETGLFLDTFSGIAVGSGIACRQQADRFLAEFDFKLVSGRASLASTVYRLFNGTRI